MLGVAYSLKPRPARPCDRPPSIYLAAFWTNSPRGAQDDGSSNVVRCHLRISSACNNNNDNDNDKQVHGDMHYYCARKEAKDKRQPRRRERLEGTIFQKTPLEPVYSG